MWSIHDGRVTTSSVSFYRLGSVTPKGNPTPTTVTPRAPPRAPGTRRFARGLCGWSVWTFEVGGRPPRGLPRPSVLPRPPRASLRCSVCQCLVPPYGDVFSRCLPRGRHWHPDCHGTAGSVLGLSPEAPDRPRKAGALLGPSGSVAGRAVVWEHGARHVPVRGL